MRRIVDLWRRIRDLATKRRNAGRPTPPHPPGWHRPLYDPDNE
jgi:hypothetical protein